MIELTPVLILAIIFGTLLGIVYLVIRRKERMAMIQKGIDFSDIESGRRKSVQSLKYGIMLVGIALGILIGKLLAGTEAFRFEEEAAYFSMIFLFGGLSLVIYHFLARKMQEDDNNEDKPKV